MSRLEPHRQFSSASHAPRDGLRPPRERGIWGIFSTCTVKTPSFWRGIELKSDVDEGFVPAYSQYDRGDSGIRTLPGQSVWRPIIASLLQASSGDKPLIYKGIDNLTVTECTGFNRTRRIFFMDDSLHPI